MNDQALHHQSVLCSESANALITKKAGVYLDNTFGYGGHSQSILDRLSASGRLIALDKDPYAVAIGSALSKEDGRFDMVHSDFVHVELVLDRMGIDQIDGALYDLGMSSMQLDDAKRGFSFRFDAPLDMRMDTSSGMTAAEWLSNATQSDIEQVIRTYGEERFAKSIAGAIVKQRAVSPIATTGQLATLVAKQIKHYEAGQHPATRTFQALRIYINDELNSLATVLPKIVRRLKCGGKLVVISFHSLEDRIVKRFMRCYSRADHLPRWVKVRSHELAQPLLDCVDRVKHASKEEVQQNPRARSAVLRVARRSHALLRE
ncbi:MAG: 16S rRNA (cytosine(1402)-N(4))-methyltransferase RsmH [Neisseriales bacterium]|nr:MAG: 16S rRNA (cytosine(1402)-N(4))-methyltransferase RsmH [Neisseriales bacterium]